MLHYEYGLRWVEGAEGMGDEELLRGDMMSYINTEWLKGTQVTSW